MHRDIHGLRTNYTRVESFSPGAVRRLVAPEAKGAEWAIVVNHGMGQQLHFETLEQIAVALRDAELRARGAAQEIKPQVVHLRDAQGQTTELLRAEIEVTDRNGQSRTVHVYESYWAPLTEGAVTLRDTTRFLLEGFGRGCWFLVRHFGFNRWVFGRMREFPIRRWLTALKVIFALLLVFAPVVLANFLTVAQVISLVFRAEAGRVVLRAFTADVARFEIFLGVFMVGAWLLPKIYRRPFLAGRAGFWGLVRSSLKGLAILVSLGALAGVFWVECRFSHHAWLMFVRHIPWEPWPYGPQMLALVWIAALAAGLVARWFLIEFMGDVAVYVSGYKLSTWDEVRNKIKRTVYDVVGAVYRARVAGEPQGAFLYEKVMVVGHSLGSVISYDTLDQLVLEDELATAEGRMQTFANVAQRTRLLLTFGSPLDKIAFLFRTKGNTDELREAAAAAWQPLIREYGFRPAEWVNIYSWADIFSGELHFYDDPAGTGGRQRVRNESDPEAWVPLAAHTEYWRNELLGNTLYTRL